MRFVYLSLLFLSFFVRAQISIDLDGNREISAFSEQAYSNNSLGIALGGGSQTLLQYKFYSPLKKMMPTGIRLEAVTADYRSLYDPILNKWNYDLLDKELDHVNINKASSVIANVFYTPRFLSSCPNSKNYAYCPPNDMNAWTNYVKNIVRHVYSKYGVKYWEIGNEPSGKNFFRAPMRDFLNFYLLTAKAIKEVDSNIMVGGYADNAYYIDAYYDFFKSIKEHDLDLLNFVTFHWYGDWGKGHKYDPSDLGSISSNIQNKLAVLGMKNVPIFLTEWNLSAEGKPPHGKKQVVSYFIAAQYWINLSKIDRAFFFRVEPYLNTNSSLLDSNGGITSVGDVFTDMGNILKSNKFYFKKIDDIYIFFSPTQRKLIFSRYNLFSDGIEKVFITIKNINCVNTPLFYDYSDGLFPKPLKKTSCQKNNLLIPLTLSNYQSGSINY
ncbi:GH39 family glycosyl hydrolase [Klebsiella sp. 2680]|uniref:GH39 family glycosyl hydrolase n=1 Tax=Klebsiella sp. 2680 TaxID=2018037 RepID=UPI00115AE5B8|nr:cellulase family glycosylhydrolase [Klebsiella sp. 2680]